MVYSATVVDKKAFLFNFAPNFQCNSITDVAKFYTSGTLVKKYLITFVYFFYMMKFRLSRLKYKIFEINDKKLTI